MKKFCLKFVRNEVEMFGNVVQKIFGTSLGKGLTEIGPKFFRIHREDNRPGLGMEIFWNENKRNFLVRSDCKKVKHSDILIFFLLFIPIESCSKLV